MTELELLWIAGLLEGEGSFITGGPTQPNRAIINLSMTDEDVVRRAAKLMGGTVNGPYPGSKSHYKPSWLARLCGRPAIVLMERLHPHMGLRRQGQISGVLAAYQDKTDRLSTFTVDKIFSLAQEGTLTQREIGNLLGLTRETVNKVLRGRHSLSGGRRRLVMASGCDPD